MLENKCERLEFLAEQNAKKVSNGSYRIRNNLDTEQDSSLKIP